MIESIEALNLVLEEEIFETINHRLLTSFFENYDIDQLNNRWCMYTLPVINRTGQEIEITKHDDVSLEPITFNVPPRPPKSSQPAENATKNHQISERSLNFSQLLNVFSSNPNISSTNPFEKTAKNASMRQELPPRPKKPVPSSELVEPVTTRSHFQNNQQTPTQTVRGKPFETNSSPFSISARSFLKSIASPSSNAPKVPAKDFTYVAEIDFNDTTDAYSCQNEHIYEAPINASSSTNPTPHHVVTDVNEEDAYSAPEWDERIARDTNIREINARLVSQEILSRLRANSNLGNTGIDSQSDSIAGEPENSDSIFQDDAGKNASREEPIDTRANVVSLLETHYDSSEELVFPKLNVRTEENEYCIPTEEAFSDIYENEFHGNKAPSVPKGNMPTSTLENTYNHIDNDLYDDVGHDDIARGIYYNTVEMHNYDPISSWDTSSTASVPCSWLAEEPLYQLTEAYERQRKNDLSTFDKPDRNNFRRFSKELDLIHSPKVNYRTLWCNVESVIAANVLGGMSRRETDLQEIKFEIYTTEVSFLKSLKLLKKHFIISREFSNEKILSKSDRGVLFMYVKPLMACSKAFLRDLEDCWKQSIFMHGIFDVICKHARRKFDIYVTYCSYLDETNKKLRELSSNESFLAALNDLEKSEKCSKLPMQSFLEIPSKRITSIALLIDRALSVLIKEDKSLEGRKYDTDLDSCLLASDYVKRVCKKSELAGEVKRRIKRLFELNTVFRYPAHVTPLSLISEKRWLIMSGDVSKHDWSPGEKPKTRSAFVRSISSAGIAINSNYTIFLFNDLLILAKKKNSDGSSFKVVDHCLRQHAKIVLPGASQTSPRRSMMDYSKHYKMLLVMNENHEKKKVEMLLSCVLKRERDHWMATLSEVVNVCPKEIPTNYVCIYPFSSEEENQLSLVQGDEVTVIKKLECGWLEGMRTRDRKTGIFPPSRVQLTQPRAAVEPIYYC